VLDMSRIESGKMLQIEEKPFSVSKFIECIEAVVRFAIESDGIEFEIVENYTHDCIIGDNFRLTQVLINLLGNANKFTKAGGKITFTIEELPCLKDHKSNFMFSVKDTGIGIPIENQTTIFMPFEQASTEFNQQGTGLGLAISEHIITSMNSTIELISEKDEGAEFKFTLELALCTTEEANKQKNNAISETIFSNKNALIVDDIDINLEIATYVLESVGMKTETARNGEQAIQKFTSSPNNFYSLILMDVQMPIMDGITAANEIRKSKRRDASTIPIIALTANAFDEDLRKTAESGMNHHINKPINNEELIRLIAKILHENEETKK
jgi:CheY-like chemotaxis protein